MEKGCKTRKRQQKSKMGRNNWHKEGCSTVQHENDFRDYKGNRKVIRNYSNVKYPQRMTQRNLRKSDKNMGSEEISEIKMIKIKITLKS